MVRLSGLAIVSLGFSNCLADIFTVENGKYIGVYDDTNTYSWAQAVVHCELHYGTTLASVHSSLDENDVSDARYLTENEAWVGLTDQDIEGFWQWVDGSLYDFNVSWADGEPNDWTGDDWQGEDCVQVVTVILEETQNSNVTTVMQHNDAPCTWEYHQFVCNAPKKVSDSSDSSDKSSSNDDLSKVEHDMLFIPLMIISSILFICTVAMISGIFYYFICWNRRPKFEMLENERLTNDNGDNDHEIEDMNETITRERSHGTTTTNNKDHEIDVTDADDDDDNQLNDKDLADARNNSDSDEPHGNGVKADKGDDL